MPPGQVQSELRVPKCQPPSPLSHPTMETRFVDIVPQLQYPAENICKYGKMEATIKISALCAASALFVAPLHDFEGEQFQNTVGNHGNLGP